MQVKSAAALIAGLATTAASFVIVPEVTDADDSLFSILPIDVASESKAQTVKVDCPGCPVRLPNDVVATDAENHLELRFRVDHGGGFDRLLVNDFELYPNSDPFDGSLTAPQVLDVAERAMRRGKMPRAEGGEVTLGYKLVVRPIAKDEEDQYLDLISVDLQIIEIGSTFVEGIPNVEVKLVQNAESLAIASVETSESKPVPEAQCESVWCMWKQMLDKSLGKLKRPGCPGKMRHGGGMPAPANMPPGHMNIPGHGHPHPHPHGGHHHGQFHQGGRAHHGFFAAFARVVVPILIAGIVGISAGLITMTIGIAIICFIRLVRGKKVTTSGCPFQRSCRKSSADEAVIDEEEKAGLMEEQEQQEAPPSYEEENAPRS